MAILYMYVVAICMNFAGMYNFSQTDRQSCDDSILQIAHAQIIQILDKHVYITWTNI